MGGFNNLHFPLLPAILLYFQTLPNHWWLQLLRFSPVACNLVVFSNIANSLVASITEIFPCCLQSCCSLKQCKIPGGVNNLNGPPLPAILLYFQTIQTNWSVAWNLVVFLHTVASITSIIPRCLQSCCIFTHCATIGGLPGILRYPHMARYLVASIIYISPLLPAILFYFQTLPTHWWLQLLKFSFVACNLVVVSNNAKYLAASII